MLNSHANAGKCNNPYKKSRVHKMEGSESDQYAVNFCEEDENPNEKMKELQHYIEMKNCEMLFILHEVLLDEKMLNALHPQLNICMSYVVAHVLQVQQIVKPGCSPEVVEVALRSVASLVEFLSSVSSKPELISSL